MNTYIKYLLILFVFIALLNQNANAQTKEETVQWITSKLNGYGYSPVFQETGDSRQFYVLVSKNMISVKESSHLDENNHITQAFISSINFNDISNVDKKGQQGSPYACLIIYGQNIENVSSVTDGYIPGNSETEICIRLK